MCTYAEHFVWGGIGFHYKAEENMKIPGYCASFALPLSLSLDFLSVTMYKRRAQAALQTKSMTNAVVLRHDTQLPHVNRDHSNPQYNFYAYIV